MDSKGEVKNDIQTQLSNKELEDVEFIDFKESMTVGLDLFNQDTEVDKNRATNLLSQIVNNVGDESDDYSSDMETILRKVASAVFETKDNSFTIHNFKEVLTDVDEIKQLAEEVSNEGLTSSLEEITDLTEEREAVAKRVGKLSEDECFSNFLNKGDEETYSFDDLKKAVENGKSFVIDVSGVETQAGVAFMLALYHTFRTNPNRESYANYSLIFDDIDEINSGEWFYKLIASGRSYKFAVVVASQTVSEMDKKLKNSVLGNCSHVFFLRCMNPQEASEVSYLFDEYDLEDFLNLSRFEFTALIRNKFGKKISLQGHLFPEYRKR